MVGRISACVGADLLRPARRIPAAADGYFRPRKGAHTKFRGSSLDLGHGRYRALYGQPSPWTRIILDARRSGCTVPVVLHGLHPFTVQSRLSKDRPM
jgi:hypothetical protein